MTLPSLENRFLPPPHWTKKEFFNPDTDHQIHFEYGMPVEGIKGIVIALPGLSEFCEKYYETARFFIDQGYGFYVIDWAYQGRSSRFGENPHQRHSDGFESDINDLKFLIENHVDMTVPLFMLGHSMGGNIGLRFLIRYPDYFQSASFSAPMLGIADLKYTGWLIEILRPFFNLFKTSYVPGGKDWQASSRKSDGTDIFSSDPIRDTLHNAWCLSDPALQVGNPTIQWVLESLKSIKYLKNNLQKISIPLLLAASEKETLVDNDAIKKASDKIPNAQFVFLENAKHEILMETDDIRDEFLNKTITIFN